MGTLWQLFVTLTHVCSSCQPLPVGVQMCLAAATTLAPMHLSAAIFKQFLPRKLAHRLSRAATAVAALTIVALSLSRSAALVINYGAPMRLYKHLPQVKYIYQCAFRMFCWPQHCNSVPWRLADMTNRLLAQISMITAYMADAELSAGNSPAHGAVCMFLCMPTKQSLLSIDFMKLILHSVLL